MSKSSHCLAQSLHIFTKFVWDFLNKTPVTDFVFRQIKFVITIGGQKMAFRENVARAAQKMANNNYLPTETDPEYYTFYEWMTDEQTDLLCLMELNQPTTADFLYEDFGRSLEDTQRILKDLADLGVLVTANMKGVDIYVMIIIVPGVYEMLVINKDLVEAHLEIARGFDEYTLKHFEDFLPNAPVGAGLMRVLPVEKAISGDTKVVKFDEVS